MKTTHTEYEYQVQRVTRVSASEREIVLKRQSQDVIIVEGTPCEVRGLREDEQVDSVDSKVHPSEAEE